MSPEQRFDEAAEQLANDPGWKNAKERIDQMIGVESAKEQFQQITNQAILTVVQELEGEKIDEKSRPRNFVIEGNPGTGKSTFANALARLLAATGTTEKPEIAPIQAGTFTGQYVNESREKTRAFLEANVGKTILIDEAQQLTTNRFGKDVADAILAFMNDKGQKTAIILAGYGKDAHPTNNVDQVLQLDPGFQRRFAQRLSLPNYDTRDRAKILMQMMDQRGLDHELDADAVLKIVNNPAVDWPNVNAGGVENIVDEASRNAQNRAVAAKNAGVAKTLKPEDFGL